MGKKKISQVDILKRISAARRFKICLELSEFIQKINLAGRLKTSK